MKYKRLADFANYRETRTKDISLSNYISTENMLPNKAGVIMAEKLPQISSASKYEVGDILISNIRPYFKKIWKANKSGSCSNDVLVIASKESCLSSFLYYALADNNFFNYATTTSKGTKMPRGIPEAIMKYPIPDISYEKQERIVLILSKYDDLIENNNKRIEILEKMAENLYKEWFVRFRFPGHKTAEFENGIPKGWEVKKIKDCIKRLPFNRLYKGSELKSEGKVIVIDQSTAEYLGYHDNEASHSADYDSPIILFGDHSCKFKLMCCNFSLGENVIPFTVLHQEKHNAYFLYYAVHKLIETEEYKRHWNRLINMKILTPCRYLQGKFANLIVFIQKHKQNLFIQNQNLTKQRDKLLPRLMNGTLEI